jgi:hypothetical protein
VNAAILRHRAHRRVIRAMIRVRSLLLQEYVRTVHARSAATASDMAKTIGQCRRCRMLRRLVRPPGRN